MSVGRSAAHQTDASDRPPEAFRRCVGALLLLTSIFFLNFMARIVQAPLMPAIEKELGLSHSAAGALFLTVSAGYFVTLLLSGFVSARLNHHRTIVLSSMLVGAALLATAHSRNVWGLHLGLLSVGLAAGLYLPSAIASLMGFVSSRHWGKAIAIHEVAPNLSFVLAPLFAEAVLAFFSWDAALTILGFGSLMAGGLFAWFGRIGAFAGEAPHFASLRVLFAAPSYWMLVALFSLGISGSYGIYTMLPLFMVSGHGMERDFANTLLAVSRIPGVIMAFAGGWLSDRIGPKRTLIIVFALNGLLTVVLGLAPASWLPYLVSIQPMLSVCFFPAGFAALSMAVPSGARHIAVSLTTPVAFIVGGGLVPALIGVFGDAYSFAAGISMVGVLILSGGVISSFLPIGRRPGGS